MIFVTVLTVGLIGLFVLAYKCVDSLNQGKGLPVFFLSMGLGWALAIFGEMVSMRIIILLIIVFLLVCIYTHE